MANVFVPKMIRSTPIQFELPDNLSAKEPPEKRGLARDEVRLLVANRENGSLSHSHFQNLSDFLRPNDCLVLNASRTLPAAIPALLINPSGPNLKSSAGAWSSEVPLKLRLARHWADDTWSILALNSMDEPFIGNLENQSLGLGPELIAKVLERDPIIDRLWKIRFSQSGPELMDSLCRLGSPIRYWYVSAPWDLDYYQTVYAREPGSMEMPSAGRAFSWKLLLGLRAKGINIAFVILHASLSSYMDEAYDAGHPPSEEPLVIGQVAAETINCSKAKGGRIIGVGTTVVRALETVANQQGRIKSMEGHTRLRITEEHDLKIVDGLITGLHEPMASHLDLLSAFLSKSHLANLYQKALEEKYLWHEFGDANLIL
jgi:S-adenosylmethionine:tRNA ribosyltransferase-isomerase